MRERALVLMDAENVFHFARRRQRTKGITDAHKEAAARLAPDEPYLTVATCGPALFRHLAAWLEARYDVTGRSYGKGQDAGVEAVVDTVVARRWAHVLVHRGKDVADDQLVLDVQLRAGYPRLDATVIVVVSSDHTLLRRVRSALRHSQLDILVVLGSREIDPLLFEVGGALDPIRLGSSLPRLYAEVVAEEHADVATREHVPSYRPNELLSRGHVRDRLLTSRDPDELRIRAAELFEAAQQRALLDDRYERLTWIAEDVAEREASLARNVAVFATDAAIDALFFDGTASGDADRFLRSD